MTTPTDIEMLRTVVYAFAGVIVAALVAFAVVGGIACSIVRYSTMKNPQ